MSRVVIVGQGYVGLPLAQAAVMSGHDVVGLDLNSSVVDGLNRGESHIDDVSAGDVSAMLGAGYCASVDASVIRTADVVVICVPTPLTEDAGPDLGPVIKSAVAIASNMSASTLVILESTTYPGTTEEVVLPLLAESGLSHGGGFFLAFSPERVDPGNGNFGISNTPKLVGGITPEAGEAAASFYRTFVSDVVVLSGAREAELAKLLENTYRHVNIALINEVAKFCHDLGIDVWEAIRGASTKPFGFQKFVPGPGVGGHCIPIDPNYLSHQVRKTLGYSFRFVELAQDVNASMPRYVADRVVEILNDRERSLKGSRILILGVTYKANIADMRESPALPLWKLLLARGAILEFFDPYVEVFRVDGLSYRRAVDLFDAAASADLVVLLQNHSAVDVAEVVDCSPVVFDVCGAVEGARVIRL